MRGFATRIALLATALVTYVFVLNAGQAFATHIACGDTITQDTTLDQPLSCGTSVGLSIGADNVTLDLNGYAISTEDEGGFGNGLEIRGHDHVTVRNGRISGGEGIGLLLVDADYNVIQNVSGGATRYGRGLKLESSNWNRIEHSAFGGGYRGFGTGLSESRHNSLEHNDLYGAGSALSLFDSDANRVRYNRVLGSEDLGFAINGADNLVEHNEICCIAGHRGRSGRGMVLVESQATLVRNNTVESNQIAGIVVVNSSDTVITRNTVNRNGGEVYQFGSDFPNGGVVVRKSNATVISHNTASGNGTGPVQETTYRADGVYVDAESRAVVLKNNRADGNTDDGLDSDSSQSVFTANRTDANADLGIEAVSGARGGGNKAFGNGNPLQCLNIDCKR